MNNYKFGERSTRELNSCHSDLRKIANFALKISPIDFGIHQGGRTIALQQQYFNEDKSRINPKNYANPRELAKVANHITIPGDAEFNFSRAFDFHVSEKHVGKSLTWDDLHLGVIIGCLFAATDELLSKGEIIHRIRSGGDWDGDGVFVYDQKLKDLPHIELVKVS
ncbi:MAG: hypothetical protein AAFY41_13500 [Bacteroidota bacterium]